MGKVMEITWSMSRSDEADKRFETCLADPSCLHARKLPPVPGDPRLDGRPWRVVAQYPYDGRIVGVDGVVLL